MFQRSFPAINHCNVSVLFPLMFVINHTSFWILLFNSLYVRNISGYLRELAHPSWLYMWLCCKHKPLKNSPQLIRSLYFSVALFDMIIGKVQSVKLRVIYRTGFVVVAVLFLILGPLWKPNFRSLNKIQFFCFHSFFLTLGIRFS